MTEKDSQLIKLHGTQPKYDPDSVESRKMLNILPQAMAEWVAMVPEELFKKTEQELTKLMSNGRVSDVDRNMRITFWTEYANAQDERRNMRTVNIYGGVCAPATFYAMLRDYPRLAYILTPPISYEAKTEELLMRGLDRVSEILDLEMMDKMGRPNTKVAEVILKAVALLDQRVKGAVIQRVENKNLNVNVGADGKKALESLPDDLNLLNAKLKELETRALEITQLPAPVPAEIEIQAISLDSDSDPSDA